jgi:hypothetical protein
VRLVEELPDRARDDRADVGDLEERLLARSDQGFEVAEMSRQVARGGLADVADAEGIDQALEGRAFRLVELGNQVRRGLFSHALQRFELLRRKAVEVGRRLDQAFVHQLVDQPLAQALDVQRAPAGEVEQRLLALRRAIEAAAAAMHCLVLVLDDGGAADRTLLRKLEQGDARGTQLGAHRDHLRDDVARAAHHHGIADAHVLAAQLAFVVQRRVGHRHAADEDWLQACHWRERTGAADLHFDAEYFGGLLLGGILVGEREARRARHVAQALLPIEPVHLVDDAVDRIRQLRPQGADARVVLEQPFRSVDDAALRADGKAQRFQPVERPRMRLHAGLRDQGIGEKAQPPRGRDARVELPHRAGGGIARVDVLLLSCGALALVQRVEVAAVHEHLAAHFQIFILDG